ncbi:ABC transporter permease [uncultured Microbacterium sp.]|uniref:Putative Permease protein n=1 Tax=uncultured Microbacterium sp. TaxID=191216 RepID=A0A1Y5P3F1_9MICO|nr:ABC transporter permease [uncultured Microbacterium sp.]SBS73182.1 putative Permease protein [uncultured Microbacterium sp.]
MNISDLLTTAVGNTLRSKARTTFTVLAIFIGAFTLTITSAIGTGVSDYIDNQIGAFGAKDILTITKTSGEAEQQEGPAEYDPDAAIVGADLAQFETEPLTDQDLDAIRSVEGILDLSSVRQVNPRYIEYDHRGKYMLDVNASANLTTPDLAAGAQLDNTGADPQILLVSSYVHALGYGDADRAVGTTVRIGIADYTGELHEVVATVAGVQNETILASGAALNDALVEQLHAIQSIGQPAATSEQSVVAIAHFSPDATEAQIDAIQAALADQGFEAATVSDQIGVIQTVVDGIIAVLNSFAVIALIAAGFGIVNTLLMSVQERTREIGLMKAMGMRGRSIYALFSTEAVFIGFLGSVLGAAAAIGIGTVANGLIVDRFLTDLEGLQVLRFEVVPVASILLTVMLIAFLAGTLPARRAARQNPIDALRYE